MQTTARTHCIAVTCGLLVGVVLQEILLSALNQLNPGVDLNHALIGMSTSESWRIWLFLAWSIGGFTAGIMASMISRSLTSGCIAGALLMLSALVLSQYAFDSARLAALFTITPLIGAAIGSWLAGRLLANSPAQRNSEVR